MWMQILFVAAGGAAGALCRYGVSLLSARLLGTRFAYGTLIVNLAGCLVVGFIFALSTQRGIPGVSGRLWIMTGFLGAMTTFSTFALESVQFVRSGAVDAALLNIALNNVAGVVLVFVGIWLGNRI